MTKRTTRSTTNTKKDSVPATGQVIVRYDRFGKVKGTKEDVCDCFDAECPGCHYPCEKCSSQKCGVKCRSNRKWAFDSVLFDGKDESKKIDNPLMNKNED